VDTFAERLRELRKRRGLSQRGLASKAGLHENYIARLERGERENPSSATIEAIAAALGVGVNHFYPDEAPPTLSDMLRDLSERCRMMETAHVPVRGTVPGEVREHTADYVEVPRVGIEEGIGVYALEVTEPLADEGIDVGDYVVIQPDATIGENAAVFVITVAGHNHLRRAWRVGSHVHVRPGVGGETTFQEAGLTVLGRVVLGGRWRHF